MASISDGGNYLSDGAIMAWLATQQDRLYGDLRDSMRSSEARAEFTNELNDIKAALHQANKNEPRDFGPVNQQMQDFMQKYGADPEFADLVEGLSTMTDAVRDGVQARLDNAQAVEQSRREVTVFVARGGDMQGPDLQQLPAISKAGEPVARPYDDVPKPKEVAPLPPPSAYDENQLKTWDELMAGKLDVAGKNDQLTMIHIQQLKATIDQGSQFGSQYISSGDKTTSSIINNIA